jgi:chemotaxis protein histidine kinase CheA
MSAPGSPFSSYDSNPYSSSAMDLAEVQLQRELQELFLVDTQQHLESYFQLVQALNPQSWTGDIQHIYRAVHTIKGGAVTVDADAMLQTATLLEDLLSDLRYLEPAPPLEDGQLKRWLLEAGELLASTLDVALSREITTALIRPTLERLQSIHDQIKKGYLPDWTELTQVHLEFAEQGFDLVVLDLEIEISKLEAHSSIPSSVVQTADQMLHQLGDIGQDLQFAEGWDTLLQDCRSLLSEPRCEIWQQRWPGYFHLLKICAKQGGILPLGLEGGLSKPVPSPLTDSPSELTSSDWFTPSDEIGLAELDSAIAGASLDALEITTLEDLHHPSDPMVAEESEIPAFELESFDLQVLEETLSSIEFPLPEQRDPSVSSPSETALQASVPDLPTLPFDLLEDVALSEFDVDLSPEDFLIDELAESPVEGISQLGAFEALSPISYPTSSPDQLRSLESPSERGENSLHGWGSETIPPVTAEEKTVTVDLSTVPEVKPGVEPKSLFRPSEEEATQRNIQIPVPLERLDQSAQQVIETLLTERSALGYSKSLQSQLLQLIALTQDSTQYVARLRQLQDDYALLRNLQDEHQANSNVPLERYRQGYTTMNRLLENLLRMNEVGKEIETLAHSSTVALSNLDHNIVRLKDTIETSRLVPFRNLSLRARAILRDLTNRFGKSATLAVQGEQVELDVGIVQQLESVLLHLLRNAFDHGLENESERMAAGKSIQGKIELSVKRRGNLYRIKLQDDGRGIDAAAIQRKAIEKGFSLTRTDTALDLLNVLCQPGFSSSGTVNDVSGRGVGMDVVASQISAVSGKLSLNTTLGQGTTFIIEIPAPKLLVPCVLLQGGDRTFAIPSQDIATTALWDSLQTTPVEDTSPPYSWSIRQGETLEPGLDLVQYWQPQSTQRSIPETAIALRIRATEQTQSLWLLADDLREQMELLITPLPNPLQSPVGVLGVNLQSDGSLIPVIDASILAEMIATPQSNLSTIPLQLLTASPDTDALMPLPHATRTILVVDDAALMRRRIEASLAAYGYSIVTCADGQEAWNWLQNHPTPAMVITDIEMPNMDGFTLIDRARQSGMTMPMVVVSSRLAEEWSQEANRLGATDYLTKGFTTQELITKVKSLL